jgi:hypothetical protein
MAAKQRRQPRPPPKRPASDLINPGGVLFGAGVSGFLFYGSRVELLAFIFAALIIFGIILMFPDHLGISMPQPTPKNIWVYRSVTVASVVLAFGAIAWAPSVLALPLMHVDETKNGYRLTTDPAQSQPWITYTITNDSDESAYLATFGKIDIIPTPNPYTPYNEVAAVAAAKKSMLVFIQEKMDAQPDPGNPVNGRERHSFSEFGDSIPNSSIQKIKKGQLLFISAETMRILRNGHYTYLPYCVFWSGLSWVDC